MMEVILGIVTLDVKTDNIQYDSTCSKESDDM